jgi:nitrate reductase (cytochrome)
MTMSFSRRDFLKSTAAGVALASIDMSFGPKSAEALANIGVEWHKTVCRYCGTGCGVMLGVADGKPAAIRGDAENTINKGLMCVKAFYLHQVVTGRDRLTTPLVRKNGALQPASWDEAMDLVARKFRESIDQHGPNSVAFYGSGQAQTEESYLANKLFKGCIGTNNIDGNPRLCMASAVAGYIQSFGSDEPVGTYDDFEKTELFFMIGTNSAEAHPVLYDRIAAHKRANPNVKVIFVDPRKTPTNRIVDLHLMIKPGYDLALMNAMAHVLVKENLIDPQFINESVNFNDGQKAISFEEYKEFLATYTPEYAAEKSGVPADQIVEAARMFGRSPTAVSLWCMGVNQRSGGVFLNNLIHNIHLLTGKLGKPGCDSFSLTGQPNACGGIREGGALSHLLPGHRVVANEQHRKQVAEVWGVPAENIQPTPGRHTIAMFSGHVTGDIKCQYVMCTNPMHSLPNLNKYVPGFENTFTVVAESFHPSETSKRADVVLPVAFWGEKEGVYTCSERRAQHLAKALNPPPGVRWDGDVLIDFATRLGYGDRFAHYTGPESIWHEYLRLTKGQTLDMSGMTYARLKRERGLRWPVPSEQHGSASHRYTREDPLFPTDKAAGRRMYFYGKPDGKAVVFARPDRGPGEETDAEYPVALTTNRILEHWHTRTMTRQNPQLERASPGAYIEINPSDARAWRIADKERVRVVTRRGSLELEARVIDRPGPGTVCIPFHWEAENPNYLCNDVTDPISFEPEYKVAACRIERLSRA